MRQQGNACGSKLYSKQLVYQKAACHSEKDGQQRIAILSEPGELSKTELQIWETYEALKFFTKVGLSDGSPPNDCLNPIKP